MKDLLEAWFAELLGTFMFVFAGAGAVCADSYTGGDVGMVGIALAHGLALAAMISAAGHLSGGHFNPAVTFAALIARRVAPARALTYWTAQLLGAIAATLALRIIVPPFAYEPVDLGATLLSPDLGLWAGILLEAILTFLLVFTVFGTAADERRSGRSHGLTIGLVVALGILVGGALTGAAMNPARAFGPALVTGLWEHHVVYWVGPLSGAGLAALLWQALLRKATL